MTKQDIVYQSLLIGNSLEDLTNLREKLLKSNSESYNQNSIPRQILIGRISDTIEISEKELTRLGNLLDHIKK